MHKSALFLILFYVSSLQCSEQPTEQKEDNFAHRVRSILPLHANRTGIKLRPTSSTPSGVTVSKVTILMKDMQSLKQGLAEMEEYDWAHAKQSDATNLMKDALRFATCLDNANKLFALANQFINREGVIVTEFQEKVDYNQVLNTYGEIPGLQKIEMITPK